MEEKQKYIVIARRFRPQTFKEIVGQEWIVTTLKNALRFNRLAHAYLFCGLRGTGKTTLARLFAKALNCQKLTEEFEPCNKCISCVEINQGRSLDVLEIDGASNRGIDDIRALNDTVGYAPSSGKYKIYIIDEVHMLTKEAFNALLKTLEEPPPQVKFFFATTEPHKVLPTIASRCQRFELSRIPEQVCVSKLAAIASQLKIDVEEEALYLIAARSEGSMRDAESLLDQLSCSTEGTLTQEKVSSHLGLTPKDLLFSLDRAIAKEELSFAFRLAGDLFNAGRDLVCFIEGLLDHFRILLLMKMEQNLPHLSERDLGSYTSSAKEYTKEQCLFILDFLMGQWENFSKTPLKRITLEMILLQLLQSRRRVPLEAVVERLIDLEKTFTGTDSEAAQAQKKEPAQEKVPEVIAPPAAEALVPAQRIEPEKVQETTPRGTYLDRLPETLIEQPTLPSTPPDQVDPLHLAKLETLLRFAAVELEGKIETRSGGKNG
ncbi:MAG: DNA polymerase III subunit gamma/tau [Chlamydiales bacterium]